MEDLLFVVWALGWPILCSLSDMLDPLKGVADGLRLRDCAPRITVWLLVWLGVAVLLYRV